MIVARAPLRISLGGGGTDLPSYSREYGGYVIGMAIARYVYVCASVGALGEEDTVLRGADAYVRAALSRAPTAPRGLEVRSLAEVLPGTGLGSSSAYAVALVAALSRLATGPATPAAIAAAAVEVERAAGVPAVGVQDHYLSALGGVHVLRIARDGTVDASRPPVPPSVVEALADRLCLFYTGVRRTAAPLLSEQAASTERRDPTVLNSLHDVKRIGGEIESALVEGNLDAVGRLMDAHWRAKKRRLPTVASPEVESAYSRALAAGSLGGKVLGAGAGGFLLLYVPPDAQAAVRGALRGLRELSYAPDGTGVSLFDTETM